MSLMAKNIRETSLIWKKGRWRPQRRRCTRGCFARL